MDNARLQNPNTHLIDICNMMTTIRLVTSWSDVTDSDREKNLCLGFMCWSHFWMERHCGNGQRQVLELSSKQVSLRQSAGMVQENWKNT
jgi:hypothetical protein